MSGNSTLWIDTGFYAPVAQVHMSPEMKQGFVVEQNKNVACFFDLNLWICCRIGVLASHTETCSVVID
jgi:hypothetical protein